VSSWDREWYLLEKQIRDGQFNNLGNFNNEFFKRLLQVLSDPQASDEDKLLAYADALHLGPEGNSGLPISSNDNLDQSALCAQLNIRKNARRNLEREDRESRSDQFLNGDLLRPVFELTPRREIKKYPLDPALKKIFNDDSYQNYNGKGQRDAVRLALSSDSNATLVINLPTGSGKTLVSHALCMHAKPDQLTLVIVPTTSLAIDQSQRFKEVLTNSKERAHNGSYCWHAGLPQEDRESIRQRIREGTQRALVCSPEAVIRSGLISDMFQAAKKGRIANLIVDEAHIIDQWGDDFRPNFQLLAPLVRSLRESSQFSIRCVLMSATLSANSFQTLANAFKESSKSFVHVNGCFLRPEIQYAVRRVMQSEHRKNIKQAILELPKPLIVYSVTKADANHAFNDLKRAGLTRLGLWTGESIELARRNNFNRQTIQSEFIRQWKNDELDIIVATSAFGLGIDKANVRSVVHIAVPETLDRFYQEVGRAGRDGKACQSLVLFHQDQDKVAKNMNSDPVNIGNDKGFGRWKAMWDPGETTKDGRRRVSVKKLRRDLSYQTDLNEKWNWKILLLMYRSRLVDLYLEPPVQPEKKEGQSSEGYNEELDHYYEEYRAQIIVDPVVDNHLEELEWGKAVTPVRDTEKQSRYDALDQLLSWLAAASEVPICTTLASYYTIDGHSPQRTCGGCPTCEPPNLPSQVGDSSHQVGFLIQTAWANPFNRLPNLQYVYFQALPKSNPEQKFVRAHKAWIKKLITKGVVRSICAPKNLMEELQREITGSPAPFWSWDPLDSNQVEESVFSQLVLCSPSADNLPDLGFREGLIMVLAPENLSDVNGDAWWERTTSARSIHDMKLISN